MGAGWKREVNKNGNKHVYLWTHNFKTASQNTNCVSKVPMRRGSQKSKHEIKLWSDAHFLNHNFFLVLIAAVSPNRQAVTTPPSFTYNIKTSYSVTTLWRHAFPTWVMQAITSEPARQPALAAERAHTCDWDKAETQQPLPGTWWRMSWLLSLLQFIQPAPGFTLRKQIILWWPEAGMGLLLHSTTLQSGISLFF